MEGDYAQGNELCDAVLRYIDQALMQDDLKDEDCMIQDSTLNAVEKSLYEVLNEKCPSLPNQHLPHDETSGKLDDSFTHISAPTWDAFGSMSDLCQSFHVGNTSVDPNLLSVCPDDGLNSFPNVALKSMCSWQCSGWAEESNSILPIGVDEILYSEENRLIPSKSGERCLKVRARAEMGEGVLLDGVRRGRKSLHREESDVEGRNYKHLADVDESLLHELFDKALSLYKGNDASALDTPSLSNEQSGEFHQNERTKGFNTKMAYTKKGATKREAHNMRSCLLQCMQAIADNDHMNAIKLLKHIRLWSSPLGDGLQRLSHYFANGLEARLLGAGNSKYKAPLAARIKSDAELLKYHKVCFSGMPFTETSYFFATQMIMELAETATTIHIIHFGIMYGIQWPPLIQRLSARPGPPKLRITGINFPRAGFHPDTRVKETGRQLAIFCKKLNVPFQYNGIAQNWETVSVEDLRIEKDEVVVVNCLYQLMHLLDDAVGENSPRDDVLNLIRRINPDIFIHCITNAAYGSPFFPSRFREALFFFSTLFDMYDAILSRESKERTIFEEEICGKAILNVIASEGAERLERPETYKQWQSRMTRAGLRQLPLNQEILETIRAKVKSCYHKDFFVDESREWLLEGWKGRALFAFSCWKAA